MRTVPEKTLRNWKTGAGTGSGRTQAKRSNNIQIKKHITVDTMQGNQSFPCIDVLLFRNGTRFEDREGCRHESIG